MRTGVASFQGERLIQARLARGLTQTALSASSGYSCASISKWERNDQQPESAAVEKIALVMGIPASWFSRTLVDYGVSTAFYRSQSSATKSARSVAESRLLWTYELSKDIQEWIDFPKLNLPFTLSRKESLDLTDDRIERLAVDAREFWQLGLGPIDNLIKVLEYAGIVVVSEYLGYGKMDGVSRWFEVEGRPYVLIATDKASAVRNRFDLAHELAHILLHRYLTDSDYKSRYDELERQAHLFSSAFLMPETIATELAYPTLDKLRYMKSRWKVSIGAMIMRSKSLGLIDDAYSTRLWKNYSARRWRTCEPLDDIIPHEKPSILSRAIRMMLDEGGFNRDKLLDRTGISAQDIESLASLPEGFLRDEDFGSVIQLKMTSVRSSNNDGSAPVQYSQNIIPISSGRRS